MPQDFALGDFDNTPIAQVENEAEAAKGPGNEAGAAGIDNEDEGEDADVARFVRVQKTATDAERRPKPGKPLIEEM